MGGLILDLLSLALLGAFFWAGKMLGAGPSVVRLIAAFGAVVIMVLAEPATTRLMQALTPWKSTATLIGLMLSAAIGYVTCLLMARPLGERLSYERLRDKDGVIGGGAALVEGIGVVAIMMIILTILPGSNLLSNSALDSRLSKLISTYAGATIRWPVEKMPSLTQTIPKGSLGADLGPSATLPLRNPVEQSQTKAAGMLLATINGYRLDRNAPPLQWNRRMAKSMDGYSRRMIRERFVNTVTPSGGELTARVNASLGDQTAIYDPDKTRGVVVWSQSTSNAYAALTSDKRARRVLDDPFLTEVGIGAVHAGWFNGTFFALGFVGPRIGSDDAADDESTADDSST